MTTASREHAEALSPEVAAALGIEAAPLCVAPLELWPREGRCLVHEQEVRLSQREFDLLVALVAAAGRVVRRERLYELVWRRPMHHRQRDVDVHIRKVRLKLAEAAPGWSFIHTHTQFGYRVAPERTDPSS